MNVAFRLSPSPAATALVRALAAAPRLHTLCTQLPTVWNVTLLEVCGLSCRYLERLIDTLKLP